MPITELKAYRTACGDCGAQGGFWRDKSGPEECVPEGWAWAIMTDPIRKTGLTRSWQDVICPDCQQERIEAQK